MKKSILVILLVMLAILLFAAHVHKMRGKDVVEKGKPAKISGELINEDGEWYLKKGKEKIEMHFGPEEYRKGLGVTIKPQKKFSAKGFIYKGSFAISTFTYNDTIVTLRDKNGKALWNSSEHDAKKHKPFYVIDRKKCIGCRLCVSSCPVNAIEMKGGRAIIDADKCIACGICENGNGSTYKGCPVSAISKAE